MSEDATGPHGRYRPKLVRTLTTGCQLLTVRCSPCGRVLAAGGCDGRIRRWDLTAPGLAEMPALAGHGGWVQALAFHPDGRRLFTADSWGRLCCWPYREARPEPLWAVEAAHDGWVRQLAVAPDGRSVATCGADRCVRLWSAEGQKRRELAGDEDVYAVAFHPAGTALVAGDLRGVVRHWDPASGRVVREFDARVLYYFERLQDIGGVRRLAFDAAGTTLACGGCQPRSGAFILGVPTLLLHDWAGRKPVQTIRLGSERDGFVQDLAWHADGFLMGVTSGQPGQGMLFLQRPGEDAPFFTAAVPNCQALAVHPDGVRLVLPATTHVNGGGRPLDRNGEYPGDVSPLQVWEMPPTP